MRKLQSRRRGVSLLLAGVLAVASSLGTNSVAYAGTAEFDTWGTYNVGGPIWYGCGNVLANDTDVGTLVAVYPSEGTAVDSYDAEGNVCVFGWGSGPLTGSYETSSSDIGWFSAEGS